MRRLLLLLLPLPLPLPLLLHWRLSIGVPQCARVVYLVGVRGRCCVSAGTAAAAAAAAASIAVRGGGRRAHSVRSHRPWDARQAGVCLGSLAGTLQQQWQKQRQGEGMGVRVQATPRGSSRQ